MESRDELGFWGMTKHPAYEQEDLVTRNNPYGYAPEHLQTYFVVFRKKLLESEVFERFWTKLLPIEKYEEAVGKFETVMTKMFADEGFAWDSFVHTPDLTTDDPNFTLYCPETMLREHRFPFMKCRIFKQDTLTLNAGDQPRDAYDYIRERTDYDVDLIWQSLLRKFDMCDFVKSMALTYVLPQSGDLRIELPRGRSALRAALFMHIYYLVSADAAATLAARTPDYVDIYISTDSEEKAKAIRAVFREHRSAKGFVIVENRGRSESALIIGMAQIALKYDVACFWKEKVSRQVDYHASLGWANKIDDALLASGTYVDNIVRTFADNPRLGMLCVPEPFHAVYHWVPGHEWAANYDNTVALAERLGLAAPMDKDAQPTCSFGGAFWFRPAALKKLFEYEWAYEDFPEEPLPIDASLLHAIERIYPFVCQDAGYYPAFVMSDRYASLEYTGLRQYLSMYTYSALYAGHQFDNYLQATDYVLAISVRPMRARLKRLFKRRMPRGLYIAALGAKRVLFGPDRRAALREIRFRMFRKSYVRKLERKLRHRKAKD
jgi:rhamnosyltransferase